MSSRPKPSKARRREGTCSVDASTRRARNSTIRLRQREAALLFPLAPTAEFRPLDLRLMQLLIHEAADEKVSKRADDRSSNSASSPLRFRAARHPVMVAPMDLYCVATTVLIVMRREILHGGPPKTVTDHQSFRSYRAQSDVSGNPLYAREPRLELGDNARSCGGAASGKSQPLERRRPPSPTLDMYSQRDRRM